MSKKTPPTVKQEHLVEQGHKNKTELLELEFKSWNYIDELNIDNLIEKKRWNDKRYGWYRQEYAIKQI